MIDSEQEWRVTGFNHLNFDIGSTKKPIPPRLRCTIYTPAVSLSQMKDKVVLNRKCGEGP